MEKLYNRISYSFSFIGFIVWYFQHVGKKGSGFSDTTVRNSNIILLILKKINHAHDSQVSCSVTEPHTDLDVKLPTRNIYWIS